MNLRLTFLGAARNVTGSRILLEARGRKILVDCGLHQERDLRSRDWDPFPVPPGEIDAVLLTHAHLDHCGYLPKLVREGFQGPVICTAPTAAIAQIVLLDSAHLQEEDARYKAKRHKKRRKKADRIPAPLYVKADAEACLERYQPTSYKKTVRIADGIEATFFNAGHILGSSAIRVRVTEGGESRSLLFSGDVGRANMPILKDPTLLKAADYVIVESTYGNRDHAPVEDIAGRFAEVINATAKAGGNIIIPSFAIERAQDILYYLNELRRAKRIPPLLTFLDSPMAIRVTEVFKKHSELYDKETKELLESSNSPFSFYGLKMTRSTEESKAINRIRGTAIIIAGSGMCTGGRIKHHLANNISKKRNTILFVGYQAVGTLGRHILERPPDVRILGVRRKIRARIEQVHGFSAHADRNELVQWLSGLERPPKQVCVVHGEENAAEEFSTFLSGKTGWAVSAPGYRETVTLK